MKSPVQVANAPKAIGPYAQAQVLRLHGGQKLVYTAGQVGLDPNTGTLVTGGVQEETAQALQNVTAVLRGAGLGLEDVAKTTVFLLSMEDFAAMNEVYARFFGESLPARSTVAVVGLPKGARVEIECVALGRDL